MRGGSLSQLLPGQLVPHLGQLLSEQSLLRPGAHQRVERHAGRAVAPCRFTRSLLWCVSIRSYGLCFSLLIFLVHISYFQCHGVSADLLKESWQSVRSNPVWGRSWCRKTSRMSPAKRWVRASDAPNRCIHYWNDFTDLLQQIGFPTKEIVC